MILRHMKLSLLLAALSPTAAGGEPMVVVREGAAAVTIVIPDEALPVVKCAAEELQYHVLKSSGANVLAVRVDNVSGPGGIWKPVRLSTTPMPVADGANLIANGDFELGTSDWRWLPRKDKSEFSIDDAHAVAGKHSAKFTLSERATGNLVQTISAPEGTSLSDYVFSMYVRTSPEFTGRIQAHLGTKANTHNTGNTWQLVTLDEITSTYVGLWVHDAMGTVWIDEVRISKRDR